MTEGRVLEVGGRISAPLGLALAADMVGSLVGVGAALPGSVVTAGDGGIETAAPPVATDRMLARRFASATERVGLWIAISALKCRANETAEGS